jgi:hypothetical protein
MPVTLAGRHDNGIARVEILRVTTLRLHTHATLDDEKPLRTGMLVPVRSSAVRECHAVHANCDTGRVVGQALDRRPAEEGCRIDGADRRIT